MTKPTTPKPTTPKPIPIPRDLKRGDVIVLNNGGEREFQYYTTNGLEAVVSGAWPGGLNIQTGRGWMPEYSSIFAVRIIRKTNKPARVDRDAKWLLELVTEGRHKLTPSATKRLRAIARRLSGEGK